MHQRPLVNVSQSIADLHDTSSDEAKRLFVLCKIGRQFARILGRIACDVTQKCCLT